MLDNLKISLIQQIAHSNKPPVELVENLVQQATEDAEFMEWFNKSLPEQCKPPRVWMAKFAVLCLLMGHPEGQALLEAAFSKN
jgi:hypothetical protein